jgi:hypothetical protein
MREKAERELELKIERLQKTMASLTKVVMGVVDTIEVYFRSICRGKPRIC